MVAPKSVHDGPPVEQHRHSMRVMGYVQRPELSGLACFRPLLAKCMSCGYSEEWNCRNASEDKCRPCSIRNRGRVRSRASDGLYRRDGYYIWMTVTAPSDKGQHCKKKGCSSAPQCGHRLCDCTPPGGIDLADWNSRFGECWNRLTNSLRARYGDIQYMGGIEPQDGKRRAGDEGEGRGALHRHNLAHAQRAPSIQEFRRLAVKAGFGHEVDLQVLEPGSHLLADKVEYLSKYSTKGATLRPNVPWRKWKHRDIYSVNKKTGQVTTTREPILSSRATYKTWTASRGWGRTMKELRQADIARIQVLRDQGWTPGGRPPDSPASDVSDGSSESPPSAPSN